MAPVSWSETIAQGIGGSCELHVFEKSGHSPPEEEQEKWEEVLSRWIDKAIPELT